MKEIYDEEDAFREIMSHSKLKAPFSDLEDKIMLRIEKQHSKRSSFTGHVRLARIFFIVGTAFGIIISIILPMIQQPILGISPAKFTLPFQIIFAFLFITQLDNLKNFYKEHIEKKSDQF